MSKPNYKRTFEINGEFLSASHIWSHYGGNLTPREFIEDCEGSNTIEDYQKDVNAYVDSMLPEFNNNQDFKLSHEDIKNLKVALLECIKEELKGEI